MIVLGANILKPISEIIEPVRSRLSFGRAELDDPPAEKKGIMERLVHFSMGLFQYSAFMGAFPLGVFFALGWAPCVVSLVFPVLIWLISRNVTPLTGGLMLFVFGVQPWEATAGASLGLWQRGRPMIRQAGLSCD